MKALFLREPGPTPKFEIDDAPTPHPREGQVVVRVEAAGICGHDIAIMTGLLTRGVDLGTILGHEISGRVAEVGPDVTDLSEGDPVVASLTAFCGECDRCLAGVDYRCRFGRGVGHAANGGLAEFVRLPARSVTRLPDGMDMDGAALLACPVGVCVRAIKSVARLSAGETALVTGAGGGLGVHAIQVSAALGAQVFAATYSPEKLDALEEFAPGGVILGGELDFSELVMAFTEDEGVNVIVDTVGAAVFRTAMRCLSQYGRMALLGEVEGSRAQISLTDIMFRDAAIYGSTGASLPDVATAIELVSSGEVRPVIHAKLPLEEASEAVRMVSDREALGRIVLKP